ncbi:uncharacterized protein DUF2799 [Roseinatronobacter thiooxidans]|uniref:Uncharacterized protein DUF2799 n=1 Tax=Roseinatronobacter thiooxidans TaxID=121821 RepID=A0A2W7QS96_9RHOB|nr:DUF2799 domain-containing protein [Roseinatronobacter thiooxidans]PZX46617.1 uncharacterized protein DUF2799 [Roseinatronobacter thiooxidans]
MRAILSVLMLAALSGCASLSRDDCLQGDWASIGERDGTEGRAMEAQFARHVTACAKVEITPERGTWEQGYARGLATYCTPQTGLREGEAGRPYRDVCPAATEARFLQGYDLGQSAHRQRARIAEIGREISQLQSRNTALSGAPQSDAEALAAQRAWHAAQSEIMLLRLEQSLARAQLLRIEREIRAFRAAL